MTGRAVEAQPAKRPRRIATALSVAALLLLGACSSAGLLPAGGAPRPLISEQDESRIGAEEHPRIVRSFGGAYQEAKLQAGLEDIVARLVRASPRPDIPYRVTVLNSAAVNAFALPGGYLYVTRGLLALANDEDELAAVLAHEMAHVSGRHAAKRESQALAAVVLGRAVRSALERPGSASSALTSSQQLLASFSRGQELEADEVGLETAVRAGFDPYGAASFLDMMGRESAYRRRQFAREENALSADFLSTHPATADRIARVVELSKRFGFEPGERPRKRERYLNLIDGLLFGDDPLEGFVRGRTYVHPGLRIRFTVPPELTLQNARDAVFGIGADDLAMRFDGVELSPGRALVDYVRKDWGEGINFGSLRRHSVDGREMVTAAATSGGWHYRLAAVRFDEGRVYRFLFASRVAGERLTRIFEATTGSIEGLTPQEAAALRPLAIRAARVRPGDTLASLANRSALGDDAAERLAILNGLTPGARLTAGTTIKTVAD